MHLHQRHRRAAQIEEIRIRGNVFASQHLTPQGLQPGRLPPCACPGRGIGGSGSATAPSASATMAAIQLAMPRPLQRFDQVKPARYHILGQ